MILCFSSDVVPILSILLSVISLAWAVVANRKAWSFLKQFKRLARKPLAKWDKVIHFIQSTLCMFLWRICTVGSRVIVFALALRVCLQGFNHSILYGIVVAISAILLVFVPGILSYDLNTRTSKSNAVSSSIMSIFFNCLDFHDVDFHGEDAAHIDASSPSRKQATVYYCVVFIITVVIVGTWYVMIPIKDDHVVTVLLLPTTTVLFILGIIFMVLHYSCCHHNRKKIRKWIPCDEIFCETNDAEIGDPSSSSSSKHHDNFKVLYSVVGVFLVTFLMLTMAGIVRIFSPYQA